MPTLKKFDADAVLEVFEEDFSYGYFNGKHVSRAMEEFVRTHAREAFIDDGTEEELIEHFREMIMHEIYSLAECINRMCDYVESLAEEEEEEE